MAFRQSIEQIVADREHGSTWLVAQICSALLSLKGQRQARQQLRWAFARLCNIDASMAVVHHLLTTLAPAVDHNFFAVLAAYQRRWDNVHLPISRNLLAAWRFNDEDVLLHSHSGGVLNVAEQLKLVLGHLEILQTRSNPGGEGELQCRQLRELGIRVQLIEDNQVPLAAQKCQVALLGVDQFTADHFVNKIGSAQIVNAMAAQGKPTFVLGDSRKRVSELRYSRVLFEAVPFGDQVHLITELGD